jgi:pimeloyl-ACP methyl ester carboxylesterase
VTARRLGGLLIFAALPASLLAAAEPASFRVTISGKGRPMILIPGLNGSGEVWDGAVARISFTC